MYHGLPGTHASGMGRLQLHVVMVLRLRKLLAFTRKLAELELSSTLKSNGLLETLFKINQENTFNSPVIIPASR